MGVLGKRMRHASHKRNNQLAVPPATSVAAFVSAHVDAAAARGHDEPLFALEDVLDGADAGNRGRFLAAFDAATAEYRQSDADSATIRSGLWKRFLAVAQRIRATPATLSSLWRAAPDDDWSAWAHALLATLDDATI